ncbi:MAG: hypothetical protein HOK28_07465 [Deltaproteobacteria bacterium]|nr:hypothetical protein [Deltaproteobacteria bacterium]
MSTWAAKDQPTIELNGDWKFAWGKFLDFYTINAAPMETYENIKVPSKWTQKENSVGASSTRKNTGFGTYFLRLSLGDQSLIDAPQLSLVAKSLCCAANVEIWDVEREIILGQSIVGIPSLNANQERARMNVDAVVSWEHLQATSLLIIVQLSNHVHARPGILSPPTLGLTSIQSKAILKQVIIGAGVFGILLIISLYHLVLFLQRRNDQLALTFAFLCFVVAVREILTSGIFEQLVDISLPFTFALASMLEYLTMPLICISGFMYFGALYPNKIFDWMKKIWGYGFGGILIIMCLFQSSLAFTEAINLFNIHLSISMLTLISHVVYACFKKKELANWVLFSTLSVVLGFTNDLLYARHIIETGYIGPYLFLMFILVQSAIIAKRFARAFDERDASNKALLETYRQLDRELLKREKLIEGNELLQAEIETASQQLIQADKLSSLGQLVAGVAHEIAGPTNYIGLAIRLVKKRVESVQTLLGKILDPSDPEAKQVLDLFNSDISEANDEIQRIESGVVKIQDIHSALRNHGRVDSAPSYNLEILPILDETLIILGSKTKLIETQRETSQAPLFTGRRSQISQVLTNLIGNAADAVEEKRLQEKELGQSYQPKILIQANASTRDNQEMLEISIHDNGYGIPLEIREKILQPFFTTKAVGKGTGLGMPIIIRIIESHGGSLEITDSQNLGGACLRFWIPCSPTTAT